MYFIIGCAFVLILFASFLDWLQFTLKRRKYFLGIRSLPFVPLVGNIFEVTNVKDFFATGKRIYDTYGKIFLYRVSVIELLFVTDSKWIESILTSPKLITKAKEYNLLKKWLGDGLLLSSGDKWRKDRKFLTPAFHFNNLSQFVNSFNRSGDVLVQKLKNEVGKTSTKTFPIITLCMLDIICESIMGVCFNVQLLKESKYVDGVHYMTKTIFRRAIRAWKLIDFLYPLSRDYWKEKKTLEILHATTDKVIKERRQYLLDNVEVNRNYKCITFLDMLLQGTIDGKPLTDKEIREQVDTFLFEGHDTTSSAICFTLYNLGYNYDVQEKIVEEIRTVMGDAKNLNFTYQNLLDLKYLSMVIKETLRIYPSVPVIGRVVEEDTVINDVLLPKGLRVMIPIVLVHYAKYGPKWCEFKPERFYDKNWYDNDVFSYIPFSAGHRNCIGQKFAMLEMKAILAKIIANFKIYPTKEYNVSISDIIPDIVLKSADDVPLRFELRND